MNDRETRILEALEEQGTVTVTSLVDALAVSAVTIRKDLEALESRRLLKRIRGGATRPSPMVEGEFPERLAVASRAKRAVAIEAAKLVIDGDTVAFDTSSTAHFVAREILDRKNLVIITQSIPTAALFLEQSDAQVIMPGGILRRESSGLVGTRPEHLVGRGRISKGFFGVTGLSPQGGLLELGLDESESKRVLAEACKRVYGIFASEKVDGFGFHSFCPVDRVTALITDSGIAPEDVKQWTDLGVPVTIADITDHDNDRGASAPTTAGHEPSTQHKENK